LPPCGNLDGGTNARSTLLISVAVAHGCQRYRNCGLDAGGLSQTSSPPLADRRPERNTVDTELVIAVDVSNSMDPEEQELQREGYIAALTRRSSCLR